MAIEVSQEERRQLESGQIVGRGPTGGAQKARYYTPSGKTIYAVPAMRAFVVKDANGAVVDSGVRDANFDRGWLGGPPSPDNLMLDCPGCDRWHRTKEEVERCVAEKNKRVVKLERAAAKRFRKEDPVQEITAGGPIETRVDALEAGQKEMSAKLDLILQALGKVNDGKVFQRETQGHELPDKPAAKSGNGSAPGVRTNRKAPGDGTASADTRAGGE